MVLYPELVGKSGPNTEKEKTEKLTVKIVSEDSVHVYTIVSMIISFIQPKIMPLICALGASRPGVKSRLRGEEGGQREREMGWERDQALEAWVPCSGGKWSPEENEKPLKVLKQRRARVRRGELSRSGGSFAGPLDFVALGPRRQGQANTAWGCYSVTGGPLQAPGSSVGQ